jgi:hypothetical protein
MTSTKNKWRLQFPLQTVILFTALVAMAIAWWLDHRELRKSLDEARKRIQFLETSTYFDDPRTLPLR